mmetsp:Transcript_66650/g.214741  ORF Transcript_66650/g.214741 Transcript_66650/m.214741 type:complete len:277 (+) Transcript_66650:321-1151(+)
MDPRHGDSLLPTPRRPLGRPRPRRRRPTPPTASPRGPRMWRAAFAPTGNGCPAAPGRARCRLQSKARATPCRMAPHARLGAASACGGEPRRRRSPELQATGPDLRQALLRASPLLGLPGQPVACPPLRASPLLRLSFGRFAAQRAVRGHPASRRARQRGWHRHQRRQLPAPATLASRGPQARWPPSRTLPQLLRCAAAPRAGARAQARTRCWRSASPLHPGGREPAAPPTSGASARFPCPHRLRRQPPKSLDPGARCPGRRRTCSAGPGRCPQPAP